MALSKEESVQEKSDTNAHISLPQELIERLKNVKNWEEWPCPWTYDEERMSLAWLWSHGMDDDNDDDDELHLPHLANDNVETTVLPKDDELGSSENQPEVPQKKEE